MAFNTFTQTSAGRASSRRRERESREPQRAPTLAAAPRRESNQNVAFQASPGLTLAPNLPSGRKPATDPFRSVGLATTLLQLGSEITKRNAAGITLGPDRLFDDPTAAQEGAVTQQRQRVSLAQPSTALAAGGLTTLAGGGRLGSRQSLLAFYGL